MASQTDYDSGQFGEKKTQAPEIKRTSFKPFVVILSE